MKGDHHDTIQDIQRECTIVLNAIPQKEYSDCFRKLFNQFQLCINSEGEYFEQKEWNFENNLRLVYLMNTVLTEPGHSVYTSSALAPNNSEFITFFISLRNALKRLSFFYNYIMSYILVNCFHFSDQHIVSQFYLDYYNLLISPSKCILDSDITQYIFWENPLTI
jgi:hypothetical protein